MNPRSALSALLPSRRMEALAHVSSWVAVALTMVMVHHDPATESNPVAEALIAHAGMYGFAALTPLLISALYRLLDRYADHHFYFALPAGLLTADAIGNVAVVATTGLPETLPWGSIVPGVAAVGVLSLACYARVGRQLLTAFRAIENRNPTLVRKSFTVAMTVLLVTAVIGPFVAFGGPSPIGSVSASLADGGTENNTFATDTTYEVEWNTDGTRFYRANNTEVTVYSASRPFDLTSLTLESNYDFSSEVSDARAFTINPDESMFYVSSHNAGDIYSYKLSTPGDVSTASFHNSQTISANEGYWGLEWNDDGTKLYTSESYSEKIREYHASDPYNITTIGSVQNSVKLVNQVDVRSIKFNDNGTKLYIEEGYGAAIKEFNVSSAYNVSTASDTGNSLSVSQSPTGLAVNDVGTKMYVVEGDVTSYDVSLDGHEAATSTDPVQGQLVTQDGSPVSNGTAQVVGVNETRIAELESEYGNVTDAKQEIGSQIQNPEPPGYQSFKNSLDITGNIESSDWQDYLSSSAVGNSEYVVAHERSAWDTSYLGVDAMGSDPSLGTPLLSAPADETFTLTIYDAGGSSSLAYRDSVDSDLPGTTTTGAIEIRQIGPGGSFVEGGNRTVETEPIGSTLLKEHETARVNLSPGIYQVEPADGGAKTWLVVGNEGDILDGWVEDMKNQRGQLTEQAQYIEDRIQDGVLVPETVQANETGHFGFNPGPGVTDVYLIGYKGPVDKIQSSTGVSPGNMNESVIRNWWDASQYNGSLYFSTAPERVTVGEDSQNVKIETVEVTSPAYGDLDRVAAAWEWFNNFLDKNTYAEAIGMLQQRLADASDEEVITAYTEMLDLAKQEAGIEDSAADKLGEDLGIANCDLDQPNINETEALRQCLNDGDVSRDDLENRIGAMEETIAELQNTIEAGEGTSEIINETLTASQEFEANVNEENLQAIVHFANGTSKTVSADSEFISIEDSTFRDRSTVHLEDFPVGESPAVGVQWRVVTEDGMGEATSRSTNPGYEGNIPALDAVDVTSLNPGPDDTVDVAIHPDETAEFRQLEAVTVYGPDGSEVDSNVTGSKTAQFATNGAGVHHAEMTFSNFDGDNFTSTFRLTAADEDRNMPGAVRIQSSPLGTYALTGDKLDGGAVDVTGGTSEISITGHVDGEERSDVPGTVHVHTHGLSTAPDSTTSFTLTQGKDGQTVDKNARVTFHTPELNEGAIVWRSAGGESEAMPTGESPAGVVTKRNQNATIQTYTDANGKVSVRVINDPGYVERIQHWVSARTSGFSLPSFGLTILPPAPATPAA